MMYEYPGVHKGGGHTLLFEHRMTDHENNDVHDPDRTYLHRLASDGCSCDWCFSMRTWARIPVVMQPVYTNNTTIISLDPASVLARRVPSRIESCRRIE